MITRTVRPLCGKMIVSLVATACLALAVPRSAGAEEAPTNLPAGQEIQAADSKLFSDEYHTPLEGEAYSITAFGRTVQIPARDTRNKLAISIGGSYFTPKIGDESGMPYASLYWKHYWGEKWRARAAIGIFVNEIDVARRFGTFEALAHWENETIPFPTTEIIDGYDIKSTSIRSGTFSGWFGAGYRVPVAPFTPDNDLRLQLFYAPGYLYTGKTGSTGPLVTLPPSTFVHGFHFRVRYDSFLRNFMELPHAGWAGGLDLELMRRNKSKDHSFGGGTVFRGDKTRDYLKLSGYLMGAAGVPGLSERHRLIGSLYAGFAPSDTIDRFSAFRIGGGPFPTESDDLYRLMYPGAMFNQFPVANYAIATLEYRMEMLTFLFLHLRGTVAYAERPFFREQKFDFASDQSGAFTLGVTSGFFWDSQIYTEYAFDAGILRNGKAGNSFLVLWSKSL